MLPLSVLCHERHQQTAGCQPGRGPLLDTRSDSPSTMDFLTSGNARNKSLVKSPSLWFQQLKLRQRASWYNFSAASSQHCPRQESRVGTTLDFAILTLALTYAICRLWTHFHQKPVSAPVPRVPNNACMAF